MKIRKEVKIGIIIFTAGLLFFWGYNFLKGNRIFSNEYAVFARYHNVSGLTKSNPVLINGMKIGQVENISFAHENNGELIVELLISTDFPIPDNSVARIVSTGITGSKGIKIELGNSPTILQHKGFIQSDVEPSLVELTMEQILPLKDKIESLVVQLDSMGASINSIFTEEMRLDIQLSVKNIRKTFEMISKQEENLDGIMTDVRKFSGNLEHHNVQLDTILTNFATISSNLSEVDINQTVQKLNSSIDSIDKILADVKSGNGTAGKLIYNDSLYNELSQSSEQLKLLLEDIRKNPKKYVHISVF